MYRPIFALIPITALAFTMSPALAGIRCSGGFQNVNGAEIATPYCQDEYLAQVAAKYGMRVSGAAVRNDPQAKEDACRLVGHDIRMQDHCSRYNSNDRKN